MSHEFKVIASKIMSIYSFGCAPKAQKMRPPEPREPLRATLKISPDQRAIFFGNGSQMVQNGFLTKALLL